MPQVWCQSIQVSPLPSCLAVDMGGQLLGHMWSMPYQYQEKFIYPSPGWHSYCRGDTWACIGCTLVDLVHSHLIVKAGSHIVLPLQIVPCHKTKTRLFGHVHGWWACHKAWPNLWSFKLGKWVKPLHIAIRYWMVGATCLDTCCLHHANTPGYCCLSESRAVGMQQGTRVTWMHCKGKRYVGGTYIKKGTVGWTLGEDIFSSCWGCHSIFCAEHCFMHPRSGPTIEWRLKPYHVPTQVSLNWEKLVSM